MRTTLPLSSEQQDLRGRRLTDMSEKQLLLWIDACHKMERWVPARKGRRGWKQSGIHAEEELQRRSGLRNNSDSWTGRASLPTESDFDPFGRGLDEQAAWREFGGRTLENAYKKFRENVCCYSEDVMFMGDRAFAFYFPMLERYLREFKWTGPRDDGPMSGVWRVAYSIAFHFESDGELSDTAALRPLVPRIRELARWIRVHLPQFTLNAEEQRQVDEVWYGLEITLAGARWSPA